MKKKFEKLSWITLTVGIFFLILAFFSFHFLTDAGISTSWHSKAQKPFVTELLGDFAILNLAAAFISFLVSRIFFQEETK